ncbi:MAG: hypothetical protein ACRD03_00225 [Acidimicrobiales bacterium]
MRATTLKESDAGLDGLLAYCAGLAADQAIRDGAARGPVDYYLDPSRRGGGGRWLRHPGRGHAHGGDTPAEPVRIDVAEVLEQGALHLVQNRRRHHGLEPPVVEGGEQEVAGGDGD